MKLIEHLERILFSSRNGKEYMYGGKNYRIDRDVYDNLLMAEQICRTMMHAYMAVRSQKEDRCPNNYFINDLHRSNLKILMEYDRICKKRGLTYFIIGGTLLGAHRHGGFIPWDDDIDVVMPINDYERIIDEYNVHTNLSPTKARLVAPSRGNLYTKIEVDGDPLSFIDIFPCECYAEEMNKEITEHVDRLYRKQLRKVLPDEPYALKAYYREYRNQLGMTPVDFNSPECRTVRLLSESEGNSSRMYWNAKEVFPPSTVKFEDVEISAPKNILYCLEMQYGQGRYYALPLLIRQHYRYHPVTLDQILNIKRFLRLEPLRNPQVKRQERVGEGLLARCKSYAITTMRNLISPIFSVSTYDIIKEYRIFYQSLRRLRTDRLLRSYLEAIGEYQRLTLGKDAFPVVEGQLRNVQQNSISVLQQVGQFCENSKLRYWLWSGSLLGAFKAGTLPTWVQKAVIMMPREDYEMLYSSFKPKHGCLQAKFISWRGGVVFLVTTQQSMGGCPHCAL